MKFIYLLCLSFIIFSYVKADEQEDYDGEIESDFSPREYDSWSQKAKVPTSQYQSSTSVKKPIIPPRPSYDYPTVKVFTLPTLKDKFDQAKKKFEKKLKDKMGALKQKKLKKVVESKIPITTTLAPVYLYDRIVTKASKVQSNKNRYDSFQINLRKKLIERHLRSKPIANRRNKFTEHMKLKTTTSTTPKPVQTYDRANVHKEIKKFKMMTGMQISNGFITIYKVLIVNK
uniref:Uncharacterized protein n=1 Tax=Tetranychus urticae TaxID=32264 RepID=T1JYJ8_TETUR